jgi:hypothetical protein
MSIKVRLALVFFVTLASVFVFFVFLYANNYIINNKSLISIENKDDKYIVSFIDKKSKNIFISAILSNIDEYNHPNLKKITFIFTDEIQNSQEKWLIDNQQIYYLSKGSSYIPNYLDIRINLNVETLNTTLTSEQTSRSIEMAILEGIVTWISINQNPPLERQEINKLKIEIMNTIMNETNNKGVLKYETEI